MLFYFVPNSQVVLCGLDETWNIAAISTVSSNQWRFFRISIPHLNEIWWCCLAIDVHGVEGDVHICSVGLRDKVDTACQFWVGIWVWGWGQDSTFIWIVSSTCCEQLQGIVLNLESLCIFPTVRVESEMNIKQWLNLWLSDFVKRLFSLHPQLVLAWLDGSRYLTATQYAQERWISWRAISDL